MFNKSVKHNEKVFSIFSQNNNFTRYEKTLFSLYSLFVSTLNSI